VDIGTRDLFRVKVTWTDFVSFAFIRHFSTKTGVFKCVCTLCVTIAGISCTVMKAVLSGTTGVVLSAVVGTSAE
jgi:hypothetical protein